MLILLAMCRTHVYHSPKKNHLDRRPLLSLWLLPAILVRPPRYSPLRFAINVSLALADLFPPMAVALHCSKTNLDQAIRVTLLLSSNLLNPVGSKAKTSQNICADFCSECELRNQDGQLTFTPRLAWRKICSRDWQVFVGLAGHHRHFPPLWDRPVLAQH